MRNGKDLDLCETMKHTHKESDGQGNEMLAVPSSNRDGSLTGYQRLERKGTVR